MKRLSIVGLGFFCAAICAAQEQPAPSATPAPLDEAIVPTYETQKLARAYVLDIPAPRGQIVDR
ncbi:MAG: hypothetical protein M3Y86_11645, partial [Verrucomicrobiota bacterium]|nr:hypothetical protein [Verrucomicrobiota bacterium]